VIESRGRGGGAGQAGGVGNIAEREGRQRPPPSEAEEELGRESGMAEEGKGVRLK
jgi:hypothetical protein